MRIKGLANMNDAELHKELERNKSDKDMLGAELNAYQKKWADYVLAHKDEINSNHHPMVLKKKRSIRLNEFLGKIKTIFGFNRRKGEEDGTETYI